MNISQYLAQHGTSEALSAAIGTSEQNDLEIPTWVIDWRNPPERRHLLNGSSQSKEWHAGFVHHHRQTICTSDVPGTLTLRGKRTHIIMALSAPDHADPLPRSKDHRRHRKKVVLSDGHAALTPYAAQQYDIVAVFLGFEVPFVLRHRPPPDQGWLLVGECYVEHIMEAQAVDDVDWDTITSKEPVMPLEDFHLY
ncbi:hypothetical protein CLAFUW4_01973 [Fulvia fulva]|uniref:Uncharacterized protein n=1 Tax=Passalora fulva TaxID=5499 RepID=A0A9Q8P424_PASFU|nr:uncharacterized protein CLAFUR5_01967 [Fulvia fulva]KAK4634101.1 hypothetical protein CLAFUR4_01968 [Fulvia fulva]KAK4636457.1 hypothetical protein CLAFUR0_01970 [Fulvia fulva]UJO12376.1 hypothetical protein CLAFUR5_01967 [Fulvia fulva]WPV09671.1 hypothetical protein CLAFUW4_01973 [Fulvia fulva]WPV23742.1 hypothetical protein CLAFUW7_01973 [Fulvia fulva]